MPKRRRVVVEHQAVDVILEEWRAAERDLDTNKNDDIAREALQARVLQLRDEYWAALAARAAEAEELRGLVPSPWRAGSWRERV